jgi:hypothetical protein
MNIDEIELNLWRKWKRNDTGDAYTFIPAPYPDKRAKGFQTALLETHDNRTFQVGFKVFENENKAMLQIVDVVYEIRGMDGKLMILIDGAGAEIHLTAQR